MIRPVSRSVFTRTGFAHPKEGAARPARPGPARRRAGETRHDRRGADLPSETEYAVLIGVPHETRPGETRVAATPASVKQLRGLGYDVVVEAGAGARASFPDEEYAAAGARVGG